MTDDGEWRDRLGGAAQVGEVLDLASGVPDEQLVCEPGDYPSQRILPAAVLREVLLDPGRAVDPRGLSVRGVFITGELDLRWATVGFPLHLPGARFERPVQLDAAELADLTLDHATLPGLHADQVTIHHNLSADHLTVTGEVRMPGAQITGQLALQNATVTNEDGNALTLDGVTVTGDLFASGLTVAGEVRMLGAQISGQLGLLDARLTNKGGNALNLARATVAGGVFARGLTATGEVRMLGAQITGPLDLQNATVTNKDGNALNLQSAKAGELFLRNGARVQGALNLTAATVDVLAVDQHRPDGWPVSTLKAAGWRIGDVHGFLRGDSAAFRAWLDRTPPGAGFVAQPWHEVAAWYDRIGHPADARAMRVEAAWRTTRQAPWPTRIGRTLYGALVGFGYHPLWVLYWLAAAVLLAFVLTSTNPAAFIPTQTSAQTVQPVVGTTSPAAPSGCPLPLGEQVTAATPQPCRGNYPGLNPITYALTTAIPAAAFTTTAWAPTETTSLGVVFLLLRTLGWILTALLLAGVTGLLRKT